MDAWLSRSISVFVQLVTGPLGNTDKETSVQQDPPPASNSLTDITDSTIGLNDMLMSGAIREGSEEREKHSGLTISAKLNELEIKR